MARQRITALRAGMCLFCLALLLSCNSTEKTESEKHVALWPLNVVVVTIDTLRPDHLRCYGYRDVETPTLDALAQRGVVFEQAVAQAPLTPPSHASIFTGQYPVLHHVRNTGGFILPSSSRTLARILQEQGWDTAAFIGSAVLKKIFGLNQGFAVYDDQMPKPGPADQFREDPERRAEVVVDRAIHWLNSQSGKPFFVWVHLYDPHLPYDPPSPFREQYRDHPYDGEIAYTDRELGRLINVLGKKAPQNTIIAVLSDHGESLGEHGEYTHGVFVYDSTLRIAFLMSGPGIPVGMRIKRQVRSIDFLPTLLELMGGKAPDQVQGTSLVPTLSGKLVATGVSYAETLYPKMNMGWAELRSIRTDRWKYVRAPRPELYDLTQDPGETTNVIQQHPAESERFEVVLNGVISSGGHGTTEKVETKLVDEQTSEELKSLGYLATYAPRAYELTGQGIDPKDRTHILKLIYEAENPAAQTGDARRLELLRQALAEDPTNPSLYYQLGGRYEKGGRYKEAMTLYRTALAKGIESGRLHSRIADLLLREGRKDEGIAEYEKAAQFNPSDLESQANLATAYLEKGRTGDAERVFKWILATDPDYATAQNGLGLIAVQRRDAQAARGYFEHAVQLDPDMLEAQLNLGLIYEMAGDRARARSCFEAFLNKASPAQYGTVIPKVRRELASLRQKEP
jgi:arylsulfatase A-like enzyme/tetratricopeptide (TPR) repeat protein